MRRLPAILLFAALASCGRGDSGKLASYEFGGPTDRVAAELTALASAHSSLSRLELRRPALRAESEFRDNSGRVTITVPGGAGQRDVVLTFKLEPFSEGKLTMVSLTMEGPDLGELDLGQGRFAGRKSLGREFGDALGVLADKVNHRGTQGDPRKRFERLFDLAAVLDDPALLARVKARGQQEGAVDFLFADPPVQREFDD